MAADALQPIVCVAVPSTYAVAVALMLIEGALFLIRRVKDNRREMGVSIGSGILAFGLMYVANRVFYIALLDAIYRHRVLNPGIGLLAWMACFVGYDFSFYVGHRAGHEVRLLWCFHSAHHTPHEMRLTTAIRGSMFDFVYLPWFFAWLPAVGFHPAMILVVESASRTWGVLTHLAPEVAPSAWFTGTLRWIHRVIVSPSTHRVHHATESAYLDRNYGEVLTVWDRLLGTYTDETQTPSYGVLAPCDPARFWDVQIEPWLCLLRDVRRAPSLRAKLRYVFDAPGWSHDGPDHRVRWMRSQRALVGAGASTATKSGV